MRTIFAVLIMQKTNIFFLFNKYNYILCITSDFVLFAERVLKILFYASNIFCDSIKFICKL